MYFAHFNHGLFGPSTCESSVTRFAKILPLWTIFYSLWQFIEGYQAFGKNLMLLCKFSSLHMAKCWTTNLAIWSHWTAAKTCLLEVVLHGRRRERCKSSSCINFWERSQKKNVLAAESKDFQEIFFLSKGRSSRTKGFRKNYCRWDGSLLFCLSKYRFGGEFQTVRVDVTEKILPPIGSFEEKSQHFKSVYFAVILSWKLATRQVWNLQYLIFYHVRVSPTYLPTLSILLLGSSVTR